jgi:SAM-dependent methyltransferase
VNSLDAAYFETLYARADDPWAFATSEYEAEKYARSLSVLRPRYHRALEIGCSIGVFTRMLASRCDALVAIDISDRALARARERCLDRPQILFRQAAFPHDGVAGTFGLIACCEVGYYWSDADLTLARDRIAAALEPNGDLLLVHFLPHVEEYVREGDAVHAAFLGDGRFTRTARYRAERYRLDLLRRT